MHHVIVKFLDGNEKRGEIFSFNMNFPVFYLQIKTDKGEAENHPIKVDLVKEILFLKKKENNNSILHKETIEQSIYAGVLPYRLMVQLKDGQRIDGSTNRYHPKDKGFFVVPLNPADKSERIYINAVAVKEVDCKRLLGKKLIDQHKITLEEVEESFRQHRKEIEERRKLEEEKEEKKEDDDLNLLKEFMPIEDNEEEKKLENPPEETKHKLLGEIIREAGYITSKQLEVAINLQKLQKNKKLGQILVDLKYVTPTDICVALASQNHLPWVDLSSLNIPREIATSLPENVVREFGIIPVGKREDILVVATSRPKEHSLIGMEVSKHTPLLVELVIAYDEYIPLAIDRYFPQKELRN